MASLGFGIQYLGRKGSFMLHDILKSYDGSQCFSHTSPAMDSPAVYRFSGIRYGTERYHRLVNKFHDDDGYMCSYHEIAAFRRPGGGVGEHGNKDGK